MICTINTHVEIAAGPHIFLERASGMNSGPTPIPPLQNNPTQNTPEFSSPADPNWKEWSAKVGTATLPLLRELSEHIPSTTKLALCTLDGTNVCALGADRDVIGKFTILGSRLFKVSESLCSVDGAAAIMTDAAVTVTEGETQTVLVGVDAGDRGILLLAISVTGNNSLGSILAQVRNTKNALEELPEMSGNSAPMGL